MRRLNVLPALLAATLCVSCSAPTTDAPRQSETAELQPDRAGETPQTRTPVTLEVGHCFVEPVRIGGLEWVTRRPYVGYGGGLPKGFTEEGMFQVESGTSAVFIAEGGAEIRFKVAPDPIPERACR